MEAQGESIGLERVLFAVYICVNEKVFDQGMTYGVVDHKKYVTFTNCH
jgi:hypothetical protein